MKYYIKGMEMSKRVITDKHLGFFLCGYIAVPFSRFSLLFFVANLAVFPTFYIYLNATLWAFCI